MVVALGLILLLLALILAIAVLAGSSGSLTIDLFGAALTTTAAGLFVLGAVAGIGVIVALWLLRVGLRKGWRRHKQMKDLEHRADGARAPDESIGEERPDTEHT